MGVDLTDIKLFDSSKQKFDVEKLLAEIEAKSKTSHIVIIAIQEFICIFPKYASKLASIKNISTLGRNTINVDEVKSIDPDDFVYFLGLKVGGIENHPECKCVKNNTITAPIQSFFSDNIIETCPKIISPYFKENNNKIASLIVLSGLNNSRSLSKMLMSLQKNTSPRKDIEIIVVINGSDDNSQEIASKALKQKYNYKIISTPQNIGIAGGYNAGMDVSEGKYIVLMQDDILFSNNKWLDELISYMDKYQDIGIIGGFRGGYYFRNKSKILDSDAFSNPYIGIGSELFGRCKWKLLDKNLVEVDSVNCMLTIHRNGIAKYDENLLPNGIEDIAFSYEIRKKGFKVFVTNIGITHGFLQSASRKENWFKIVIKLLKSKIWKKSSIRESDLKKRMSRAFHFNYFIDNYGDMLRDSSENIDITSLSLDEIAENCTKIERDQMFL